MDSIIPYLILEIPYSIPVSELLKGCPDLWQDSTLKATHVEEKVGVVLAVDGDKAALPLDGRDRSREAVLDVPEDGPPQVHVVLHEPHPSVSRPALLVVVTDNVLIIGVRVLCEVALDQVTSLLRRETEKDMHSLDVARVETDGMGGLRVHVLIGEKIIWHLRWTCHLTGSLEA